MVAHESSPASPPREDVPTSVYRYYDRTGVLLYVGVTSRGIARNVEHNTSKEWFRFVTRQEVEHYPTRRMALRRETALIHKYRPPFNKQQNPGHELTRDAYLKFGSFPLEMRKSLRNVNGQYPKTLWFVPTERRGDRLLLRLHDVSLPVKWSVVNPFCLTVRDFNKNRVGQIISLDRVDDVAVLYVQVDRDPIAWAGIELAIKWPPTELKSGGFEMLHARARFASGVTAGVA